jgi:minor extracellular serine protease Vpr
MGDALRRGAIMAVAGLAVAALAAPAGAEDVAELVPNRAEPRGWDGSITNETTGLWFVELESSPTAEGTSADTLAAERDRFRADAGRRGLRYVERLEFDTLFNGLSVQMDESQLGVLKRTAGVSAVYPVVRMEIPETATVSPDLATALAMTGADVAQSELGLTGDGAQVAVMDTGIDYDHPDLGGPGPFPTSRVVAGYDFVGDEFDAGDPEHVMPVPDNDPMDCNGHGTHVAGIVGADAASSDGATGVAPGVTFGAYKVFGCTGSTTADVMIAAMEMALADGMDVLNMSIGSAFTWPQYPTAVAADLLVQAGVSVVASIGNSGANGLYSAGAPGLGADVIGVASFDNTHIDAQTFVVNPGGEAVPYLPLPTAEDPPTSGDTPEVVYVGRGCVDTLGDVHEADPSGTVALIVRGDCTFDEKYAGVVAAGAVGVVVYNNVTGLFAGGGIENLGVFGIGISDSDGKHIRSLLGDGQAVTLTWTSDRVTEPNPIGGLVSSFSSYGLSPDLALKPDIAAPGGLIRSTYPLAAGGYATVSGTSMSSPHVAGAVALLLEARPELAGDEIRRILQNTADPAPWWGNPDVGFLDNVHRQGAGMIDIPDAVNATTAVVPSTLSLGEGGPRRQQLVVDNTSAEAVEYTVSHEPALGTHGSTFAPSFNAAFATVEFSTDSFTLLPGEKAVVKTRITPPADTGEQLIYGGYVVVTDDGGTEHRVPYAGYAGDYQEIEAIRPIVTDDEVMDLPWLAALTSCDSLIGFDCIDPDGTYENQQDGGAFTLGEAGGLPDIPYVLVHLDHQVEELSLTVLNAATGKQVHGVLNRAVAISHERRSSTPGAFFAYAWDGSLTLTAAGREITREVPDGTYLLRLDVLKGGGDRQHSEHWESWTSPPITIDRG